MESMGTKFHFCISFKKEVGTCQILCSGRFRRVCTKRVSLQFSSLIFSTFTEPLISLYLILHYAVLLCYRCKTVADPGFARRGGGKSEKAPARLSKRSATISWQGACQKIWGFTNPPDGRKWHFPTVLSWMGIGPIKNMFSTHFKMFPNVPTSWSTWQISGG